MNSENIQQETLAALKIRVAKKLEEITSEVMEMLGDNINEVFEEANDDIEYGDLIDPEAIAENSRAAELIAEQLRLEREINESL